MDVRIVFNYFCFIDFKYFFARQAKVESKKYHESEKLSVRHVLILVLAFQRES